MKFFIVSALVAAVSAEAQYLGAYPYSGLAYGYGGYPYAAGYGLAGVPFGSSTGLDVLTQGLDPVTQGYAYYGKRSAEAEPEADAQILTPYAAGLGYGYAGLNAYNGLYGLGAYNGLGAYSLGYAAPVTALNYGAYGLSSYYGKRSAEAEPEADAQILTSYAGLGYGYAGLNAYNGLYGLGAYHGLGAYNLGYAAPFSGCRNYVGAPVPC